MTQAELYAALLTLGLPVSYNDFKGQPTDPPYIAYRATYDNDLKADNYNYKKIRTYDIELYTLKKDVANEFALENLLDANRIGYSKTEVPIPTENLYEVVYTIQI